MAYKMLLKGARLPFIWNVTKRVGCSKDSINEAGDVELVNFFLDFMEKFTDDANTNKVANADIKINGQFTAASGFWLFFQQRSRQVVYSANCVVDGKISPATRYDPIVFTIAYFNEFMFVKNRQLFDTLATNPKLSGNLRNQLSIDMH